jgi:hypothetical protein
VTITATSVTDTTKSKSATITITNVLADGTYVYHFSGNDSTGPAFFAGAFTVVGGVITGGEQDFTNAAINDSADQLVTSGCSLSVTGSTIQIVLQVNNTNVGANGVETLRGLASTSSRTLISQFDTSGVATGSIDLQTSAAAPSGGYAFAISGWYFTSTASNPFAIGGILNISGTSLVVANSVFDFNLVGNVGQKQLFASGSVTAPDSFGRVTFTLTPTSTSGSPTFTSGVPAFILTGYVQSPGQIQLVEQADPLNGDLGGVALGQGSNTNQFTASSVANTTYVFAASGEDVNNLATFAGGFAFNSSGGVSGNLAINDLSFAGTSPLSGGSYTVDATGRVTISNVAATISRVGGGTPGSASFSFQLYLDGNGNALELGADSQQVTTGPAYLQTATSADFEGSYALAGQGALNTTPNLDVWGAAGPVVITSDNLVGSTDYNAGGFNPTSAVALTGTETSSSTTLSIIGLDASSTSSRGYTYFPIDSRRFVAIETDGAQIGLLTFEGVTH